MFILFIAMIFEEVLAMFRGVIMKEYWLGIYEKAMPNNLSLEDKLRCAREHGYDFLELSIDETDEKLSRLDWPAETRGIVRDCIEKIGIPVRSICLSGHRKYPLGSSETKIRAKSLEIMEKAIILAFDLGVRIIQIAGYDVYYEESTIVTKELFLEDLKKSVEIAAKYGVILAFETMETEFMNTVEKAMKYVKLVNSPYLQVYPDIGNITNAATAYKDNLVYDLELGKGHMAAMHLKETIPGKFREIPYGKGHVDFVQAIKFAYNTGVRSFVTEFWYLEGMDYKKEIRRAKEFIDDKFEEALLN